MTSLPLNQLHYGLTYSLPLCCMPEESTIKAMVLISIFFLNLRLVLQILTSRLRWLKFRHWDLLLLQIVSEARNLHFYLLVCLATKLASSKSLVFFSSPHILSDIGIKKLDYICLIDCGHLLAALSELDLTSYIPSSGVQLGYTIIFGWYAAFLFIRTGLTHSFMLLCVLLFSCYCFWNSFFQF